MSRLVLSHLQVVKDIRVILLQARCGPEGELYSSMTVALEGGRVVSSTPQPHFTPGKDPVPILQEAEWAPGPVWTGGKSRPHRYSIQDCPARSQSLYRLSYPAHVKDITNRKYTNVYVILLKTGTSILSQLLYLQAINIT